MEFRRVLFRSNDRAIRRFFFISSSNNSKIRQQYVDELDSDKRCGDSSHAIDQQVAAQQSRRTQRTIAHAAESERNQGNVNKIVENNRGEGCRIRNAGRLVVMDTDYRNGS